MFNDSYGVPVVTLDERTKAEVSGLIDRIRAEQEGHDLAYGEAMLAP